MKLPEKEEQLMEIIWNADKIFMKEILNAYPKPKPAPTTIATLLKRLIDKKIISYVEYGNSRQYFSNIKKADYFSNQVNGLIKNFFNDSASQFASFFTKETNLSNDELLDLQKIIEQQIKNQSK